MTRGGSAVRLGRVVLWSRPIVAFTHEETVLPVTLAAETITAYRELGKRDVGKGKRNRRQRADRAGRPTEVVDLSELPFATDAVTVEKLGGKGLVELAANLWPVDCQSCGRPLGDDRPALYVGELVSYASATLHHRSCRIPEWSTSPSFSSDQYLSWTAQSFLLPAVAGGRRDDRPVMLVNPSLEQVGLRPDLEGNWSVTTVAFYRQLGLRSPGRDFVVDRPIPDITARLRGTSLTVELDHRPLAWSCNIHTDPRGAGDVLARIRELEGVTLGVTTAINPHDLRRVEQLAPLIQSGQLTMGWIPLAGSRNTAPLREQPAPDALTTYVLHWSSEHATIGELLASTGREIDPEQAQRWAQGWLGKHRGVAAEQTIGWKPVWSDPDAYYTIDALSVGSFFVRRHQDGWKLVRVISRIDGSAPGAESDARKWAEGAVRIHDGARVLTWVPGPATGPGFTTLHASATQHSAEE